jgi:hypothetical protein
MSLILCSVSSLSLEFVSQVASLDVVPDAASIEV